MEVRRSVVIERSAAELWPYLVEPRLAARWLEGVEEFERTSDGPRVGATYRLRVKEGHRTATYELTLTAFEPHRHVGFKATGGSLRASRALFVDYQLVHLDASRTRLDYTMAAPLGGVLRLVEPIVRWLRRRPADRLLARLSALVEGRPTAPSRSGRRAPRSTSSAS